MNRLTLFIPLLLANFLFAQPNDEFLTEFLFGNELKLQNELGKYNQFDFSGLWTKTENYLIFGVIGQDHQRIRMKLISVEKSPINENVYFVYGKSKVKEIICDFKGVITLSQIRETKELQYGIDDEYADKGVKSQGVLMANYVFWESFDQAHSGIFQGILYSKWYLNSDSNIKYDDILQFADGYSNNAFIGTWKSYSTGIEKICNWADFRVPMANSDFDIGVGDFAPSEKYWDKGWETYLRAWSLGDKKAESEEFKIWWQ